MPFLKHWPQDANLFDIYRADAGMYRPLAAFTEAVLRGPSSLAPAQRETIAAYVSGLNACKFCYGSHSAVARVFGVEDGLLDRLLTDVDAAPVDASMKPLLRLARKITLEETRITQADVDAVFAAGWDEKAYRHTVAIAALSNMMNRLVDGFGLNELSPALLPLMAEGNRKYGYLRRFEMALEKEGYPGIERNDGGG